MFKVREEFLLYSYEHNTRKLNIELLEGPRIDPWGTPV